RGDSSRRRILVADDEPHIRRVLETLLESSGFDVDSVADGAEALARLRDPSRTYALVLTDLMMPGRSGLDVLAGLRAMEGRHGLPVVVLTAKGQDADRQRAVALGAADFLTKPFSPRKLLARIVEILDGDP
ncbi:MAG: response regulator, partial [Longimicrobiales bacterium]